MVIVNISGLWGGHQMRITRESILRLALAGVQRNLSYISESESQVSSGLRVRRPSDAPLDVSQALQIETRLKVADRYSRSGSLANTRMSAESAVLGSTADLLRQAREAATAVREGGQTAEAGAEAIRIIREQVIALANTRVGGQYILSGTKSDTPPFDANGLYKGSTTPMQAEIASELKVTINHTGDEVLSGVINDLDTLASAVNSGNNDAMDSAIATVRTSEANVSRSASEIGSWQKEIQDMSRRLASDTSQMSSEKDELLNADPTESLLKLQQARTNLDLAYASVSQILNTSLVKLLA